MKKIILLILISIYNGILPLNPELEKVILKFNIEETKKILNKIKLSQEDIKEAINILNIQVNIIKKRYSNLNILLVSGLGGGILFIGAFYLQNGLKELSKKKQMLFHPSAKKCFKLLIIASLNQSWIVRNGLKALGIKLDLDSGVDQDIHNIVKGSSLCFVGSSILTIFLIKYYIDNNKIKKAEEIIKILKSAPTQPST